MIPLTNVLLFISLKMVRFNWMYNYLMIQYGYLSSKWQHYSM